jgi:hypothetical protein
MSGEKESLNFSQQSRSLAKIEPQTPALSLVDVCKVQSPKDSALKFVQIDWQAYLKQFGLHNKDSIWGGAERFRKQDLFSITRYYEMYDQIVHQYVAREQKAFKGCGCYNCLREHRLIAEWYVTPNPNLD